jgi:hypothetical protein
VMEEAWQKLLGMINFTRGQQALPGMIIDRQTHGDVRYSLAYYSATGEKGKAELDERFNLRPALACVGDYLILSSTDGLAKDLIDAMKKEMADPPKPLAQTNTLLEIDAVQTASILAVNRKALSYRNMLDKGTTPEQAQNEIDTLISLVRQLGKASLELATRDGQTRAILTVNLNLP